MRISNVLLLIFALLVLGGGIYLGAITVNGHEENEYQKMLSMVKEQQVFDESVGVIKGDSACWFSNMKIEWLDRCEDDVAAFRIDISVLTYNTSQGVYVRELVNEDVTGWHRVR